MTRGEMVKERIGVYSMPTTREDFEYQINHLEEAASELEDVLEHISNTCFEFTDVYLKICEMQSALEELADEMCKEYIKRFVNKGGENE